MLTRRAMLGWFGAACAAVVGRKALVAVSEERPLLDSLATKPVRAYATRRLSGSYEGPLFRAVDAHGSEFDVYPGHDGNAEWPTDEFRVLSLYDQSGNGNDISR